MAPAFLNIGVLGHSGCYAKRNIALISRDALTGGENVGVGVWELNRETQQRKNNNHFTLNYYMRCRKENLSQLCQRSKCDPCDKFPGRCSLKGSPRALSVHYSDPQAVSLFTLTCKPSFLVLKEKLRWQKNNIFIWSLTSAWANGILSFIVVILVKNIFFIH